MKINPEVLEALKNNKPVVALESTIISHGMPYPKNVQTALMVEQVIRDHGVVPATIGIIDGEPIVGMSKNEIENIITKLQKADTPPKRYSCCHCQKRMGCYNCCSNNDFCQYGWH